MYVIEVFEKSLNLNNALMPRGIFTGTYNERINGDPLTFIGYDELNEKYANPYTTVFKTEKGAENKIENLKKKMLHIDIKNDDTFESIVKFQELQIKNLETKLEVYKNKRK